MIDFTTVQTFAPLPELSILNSKNIALSNQNKVLNNVLVVFSIIAGAIIIIAVIRSNAKRGDNKIKLKNEPNSKGSTI